MKAVNSLFAVFLLVFSNTSFAQQDDIFDFMPGITAAAVAFQSCSDGVFATCDNAIGCRAIDGLFENNQCQAKPIGRSLAEQFAGRWSAVSSLDNGDFFNYFSFNLNGLLKIRSTPDYAIRGESFTTNEFRDSNPYPSVVSFDSANQDWFILDYWGTDIGVISSIEISQTSVNQFDGCEFLLNFPDMTYQDNVCNPVRLRRVGSRPSLIRVVTNIADDLSTYIANLFGIEQNGNRPNNIAVARPSVDRIPDLPTIAIPADSPIQITTPTPDSAVNGSSVAVVGQVEVNINLGQVSINGQNVTTSAGQFDSNAVVEEGINNIVVVADYGRRTFESIVPLFVDTVSPTVVAAGSTSSSTVVVQFSEAMGADLIASAANFNISRNDNDANLPITALEFVDATQTAVRLSTGLQSNTQYTLRAINARDVAGNTISGPIPEVTVSLSSATFTGTRPTGDELLDTDNDGIFDHIELAGYTVTIRRTDGSIDTVQVTSDPFGDDADNDGVSDAEERQAGTDPLNSDTDGDTLSDGDEWNRIYSNPADQDTDRDGIQDGFEFLFFKTSPILADSDGDQIDDPTELAAGNRNPLVSDIPSPDIDVGSINLQLDTRFTFTDSEGQTRSESQTSEATLSQSENDSLSSSNENSTSNTISNSRSLSTTVSGEYNFGGSMTQGFGARATVGFSVTGEVAEEEGSARGATVQFGEESSRASEEAYHDSLTSSSEVSVDETVTREVIDAAVRVDLSVDNAGDIPFTISNLELTALTQDPSDRRELIPVASLTPQNSNLDSLNIGALGDTERGPFVFATDPGAVFPAEIEQLLKNPRGLIVQLANFDIVDEQGNNFAFTSQQVLDRTAGVSFDLGDGRTESYRIATASDHNESTGEPSGITMKRALEIIGLTSQPTIRDGGNGRVDSFVVGDDVAVAANGSFLEPLSIVIEPGENGVIDSIPVGDDRLVQPNYETTESTPAARIVDGGNGRVDTMAAGGDVQIFPVGAIVPPGQLIIRAGEDGVLQTTLPAVVDPNSANDDILLPVGAPREELTRFRDVQVNGEDSKFWVLFTGEDIGAVDLNDIVLRSGQQYNFTYVQDSDGDGVWAREEYLHGSSDELENTDGCDINLPPPVLPLDPLLPLDDQVSCDTLTDAEEIQDGWRVQLRTSPQSFRVYSNPNQADSDRDFLLDHQESACGLDPRQRDTDLDGLTDYEELTGNRLEPNQDLATIAPYSGSNGNLRFHIENSNCDEALSVDGFATDPLSADTDGDRVNDLLELRLGLNPNDPSDADSFLDDDGDGLTNGEEIAGYRIFINGDNIGIVVTSEPNIADTDGDLLPDLLEQFLGSDPRNPDTDGDGILDQNEYRIGGDVCIGDAAPSCIVFSEVQTRSYNDYLTACEAADACDNSQIETAFAGLGDLGTNLNHNDTDADDHFDFDEIRPGQRRVLRGDFDSGIRMTGTGYVDITLPRTPDSDDDDLSDGDEVYTFGSNAAAIRTDSDDDLTDGEEVDIGRDPRSNDRKVRITPINMTGNIAASTNVVRVDVRILDDTITPFSPMGGRQICTGTSPQGNVFTGAPLDTDCGDTTLIVREDGGGTPTITIEGGIRFNNESVPRGPEDQCEVSFVLLYDGPDFGNNTVYTSRDCDFGDAGGPRITTVDFSIVDVVN